MIFPGLAAQFSLTAPPQQVEGEICRPTQETKLSNLDPSGNENLLGRSPDLQSVLDLVVEVSCISDSAVGIEENL